ncbi:decapping and exoribonuclease protein-like [Diadema antillarum]|uniref:decapping and exoribonuclease protein-like n=1 Tax=Diadema antillarum TaxID=105358 RepID=UPI003A8BD7C8
MASNDVGFRDHVVLGTFSRDEDMNYCNDLRNRRFFVKPDDRPNFDLLHGIDDYVDRGDHDDRDHSGVQPTSLTPVLEWIRDHQRELKEKGIMKPAGKGPEMKMDVDFVARRGLLMNLLRAAKDVQGVGLLVTRYNGTYYLEGMGRRRQAEVPTCPREIGYINKRCLSRFDIVKSDKVKVDGGPPDIDQPINARSSYYSITKATCGDYTFLLSGETVAERKDAVELPPMNYVDVKTNQALSEDRYKTLRWWAMNHISGVSDIVVGWRDDRRNVITSTEMMRTEDLPNKAAGFWDPESCVFSFLSFVEDIRRKIPDDDPSAVYCMGLNRLEISRDIRRQLQARRLSFSRKEDDYVILKDWYLRDVLKVPE